ncbi:unnamed protein product [Larinioides sclopetarius]|uniref:Uncharacterized protein n=1 Tax=Larinioides sclopetarius TaxID=280406 RepID=A0AAV2BJN4_9ARAC
MVLENKSRILYSQYKTIKRKCHRQFFEDANRTSLMKGFIGRHFHTQKMKIDNSNILQNRMHVILL